jgi:general stress protein YciG
MSTAKKRRGFAAMSPDKQREIARKGGRAAHANGKAHEFSQEEASAAGRIGGKQVSSNAEHMAKIGRMGGLARGKKFKGRDTKGDDA